MISIHHDLWLCAFLGKYCGSLSMLFQLKYFPGMFGFCATRAIHAQLEAMRKVTEIAQDQGSKSDEQPRNGLEVTFHGTENMIWRLLT